MLHVGRVNLEVIRALLFEDARIIDVDGGLLLLVFLQAESDSLASARLVAVDAIGFAVEHGRKSRRLTFVAVESLG